MLKFVFNCISFSQLIAHTGKSLGLNHINFFWASPTFPELQMQLWLFFPLAIVLKKAFPELFYCKDVR